MRETKVNLKHLLEDIRDSYTISQEEIILAELAANGLDSGASKISFFIDKEQKTVTATDNGRGMKRDVLCEYHNIASTTKERGKGIGFAGIGAKLALLVAEQVITETKGGYGSRCATEWKLKNETSAPWKFIPFSGKVETSRGTSVSIKIKDESSSLLKEDFISKTIVNLFLPLFLPDYFNLILKAAYNKGVEIYLNKEKIVFQRDNNIRSFQIRMKNSRALLGVGFLSQAKSNLSINGLAVSTFGKIIKSGWEWVGILPKESNVWGVVEIPALSSILTTNKMDFLKDVKSLKKYYGFRKAIQSAIVPILNDFGVLAVQPGQQKSLRKLRSEVEKTLRDIIIDFPELGPLFGIKKTKKAIKGFLQSNRQFVETSEGIEREAVAQQGKKERSRKKKVPKGPSLVVGLESLREKDELSRMLENKIWINIKHPAFERAQKENSESNLIIFAIALTLSQFLVESHSPQKFIDDFLRSWGKEDRKTQLMLV